MEAAAPTKIEVNIQLSRVLEARHYQAFIVDKFGARSRRYHEARSHVHMEEQKLITLILRFFGVSEADSSR